MFSPFSEHRTLFFEFLSPVTSQQTPAAVVAAQFQSVSCVLEDCTVTCLDLLMGSAERNVVISTTE